MLCGLLAETNVAGRLGSLFVEPSTNALLDYFGPEARRSQVAEFVDFETAWRSWFEVQSAAPLEVAYETLSREPQKQLARILDTLGADASIAYSISKPTAKLADGICRLWRDLSKLASKESNRKADLRATAAKVIFVPHCGRPFLQRAQTKFGRTACKAIWQ